MASNVCIDGLFLTQRYRFCGINRYLVNLLRGIERCDASSDGMKVSVLVSSLADLQNNGLTHQSKTELVACPTMRLRKMWKRVTLGLVAKHLKADVLLTPCPNPLYLKPKRLAITIHDIIPLLLAYESSFWGGAIMRRQYASSLRKADLIFTDSEYSKADIISHGKLPSERVVVSYLGYDSNLFGHTALDEATKQETLNRFKIFQPYILHVGMIEPRKNLNRLVQAYRQLLNRRKGLTFQLVLCGRKGWGYDGLMDLLRDSWFQHRVIMTDAVSDQDLAVLYKAATGCAMPSVYEGFGLPVLEAMASGVPVMSSNRSSLPEVGADAVLYFDPESVEEMSFAMERLLSDSTLRRELIGRGLERAKQFSWEACARVTLKALRNL